jgi:hypothetical protein
MEARVRRLGEEQEDVMADTKGHLFGEERDVSVIFGFGVRSAKMERACDEWQSPYGSSVTMPSSSNLLSS